MLGLERTVSQFPPGHIMTIPATDIAREHTGRTVPNAVLLGGMAALAHPFDLESVELAIRERFPGKVGEMNVAAARAAYQLVEEERAANRLGAAGESKENTHAAAN